MCTAFVPYVCQSRAESNFLLDAGFLFCTRAADREERSVVVLAVPLGPPRGNRVRDVGGDLRIVLRLCGRTEGVVFGGR